MSTANVIVGNKLTHPILLQLRNEDNEVIEEHALRGIMRDVKPFVTRDAVSLTPVPEDFWEAWAAWAEKNKFDPFVKGFIFANHTPASAKAEGREKANMRVGTEQLRPDDKNDPRTAEFRAAKLKTINYKDDNED